MRSDAMVEERGETSLAEGRGMGEGVERGEGEDSMVDVATSVVAGPLDGSEGTGPQAGELLPGLSNDITLHHIAPRLHWRDVYVLVGVSRSWQAAIRSRQVLMARVGSPSADALIVLSSGDPLTLYCARAKLFYELPPCPLPRRSVAKFSGIVAFDGKIYVLGADTDRDRDFRAVFVYDLVEQRWKQCANLLQSRSAFSCGVFDGKIYVLGGFSHIGDEMSESEVYDPEVDAWTRIAFAPSPSVGRRFKHVGNIGEEMFVGKLHNAKMSMEAYNPVKDEWRVVQFSKHYAPHIFIAQGRFHRITRKAIEVYDEEKIIWQHLQSYSFACLFDETADLCKVLVANGELLGLVEVCIDVKEDDLSLSEAEDDARFASFLIRSEGFRSDKKHVLWHVEAELSTRLPNVDYAMWCTLQL